MFTSPGYRQKLVDTLYVYSSRTDAAPADKVSDGKGHNTMHNHHEKVHKLNNSNLRATRSDLLKQFFVQFLERISMQLFDK